MTNQHPISVPDELLRQWCQWNPEQTPEGLWRKIADNSAQWGADQQLKLDAEQINQAWQKGADQELEACYYWIENYHGTDAADSLEQGRRPKPPSEADQALADLDALVDDLINHGMGFKVTNVRRALKRLKELEALPND